MQCYGQTCEICLKIFGTESLVSIIDSLTINIRVPILRGNTTCSLYSVGTISKYCTLLSKHRQISPTCLVPAEGQSRFCCQIGAGTPYKGDLLSFVMVLIL